MRTIIEYMQLCHIHLYQKIARRKVASVNAALSRIYTGDFFACDFLIKIDLAKLHFLNGGFDHDNWHLTDGNNCLKLVSYQYCYN